MHQRVFLSFEEENVERLYIVPILLFSIIIHEIAHGYVAYRLGDSTARDMGRLTLNPFPHIDPFGSILLPLFAYFANMPAIIGWAKPVPVNPDNFNFERRDNMLVSFAGPGANIFLALGCVFATIVMVELQNILIIEEESFLASMFRFFIDMFTSGIVLNVVLALFNLIPIPPLDGSHIVASLLPESLAKKYQEIGFLGIFVVLFLWSIPVIHNGFVTCVQWVTSPYFGLLNMLLR